MVGEIRIYMEGGGDGKNTKHLIRTGFGKFLEELRNEARSRKIGWRIIACGSRNAAFADFQAARRIHPESFNLLLVDAEGPVSAVSCWQHLRERDGWDQVLPDKHCQLMVQTMEAWFIADVAALQRFYGQDFHAPSIPKTRDVEQIGKAQIESALRDATRNTQKGRYHKIRHGAQLLKLINLEIVRKRARYCERLFATLTDLIIS